MNFIKAFKIFASFKWVMFGDCKNITVQSDVHSSIIYTLILALRPSNLFIQVV